MRAKSKISLTPPVLSLLTILSACSEKPAASATDTSRTICRELRADLPSWSRNDTAETLASGARFVTVFNAVCPETVK